MKFIFDKKFGQCATCWKCNGIMPLQKTHDMYNDKYKCIFCGQEWNDELIH